MLKAISKNITLENVKKSNYWDLIAMIVWNHYSEKERQDESMVEISEDWCGKTKGGSSHGKIWQDPSYTDGIHTRTLDKICIKFSRTDYITYIYINVSTGEISWYGLYTDKDKHDQPRFSCFKNIEMTNWLWSNNFIGFNVTLDSKENSDSAV